MKHALLGIGLLALAGGVVGAPQRGEPSSNEIRDRYELSEVIKRAVDRSAAELIVEADGTLTLKPNGSHRHVYMARIGADGQFETFCATSERAVRQFLFERLTHLE